MTRNPDVRFRGSRAVRIVLAIGLLIGSTPAALGEAGLSEALRARAAWLKRPYALVFSGDKDLGPDHAHLVRARDARWNDVFAIGGAIVPAGSVSGVGDEDLGPFAVVGSRFVFRFNKSEDFGVLDMDRADAEVERLSRADLVARFGAVPELVDFDAYHAAHWSWPNPVNALVGWTAGLLLLAALLTVFVVIPFTIAWMIIRVLRRLARWAFVPLFGRSSSVDPRP